MRVMLFVASSLLALLFPSAPIYVPLNTNAPQIMFPSGLACPVARQEAQIIANSEGYARADVSCGSTPTASLFGKAPRLDSFITGLVDYSIDDGRHFAPIAEKLTAGFRIDGVPFVTGRGEIIVDVSPDAILVDVTFDKNAESELENGGVPASDIRPEGDCCNGYYVRVRPATQAGLSRLARIIRRRTTGIAAGEVLFLRDCNSVVASSTALALRTAAEHARIIAQAATSTVGPLLGIVDSGARVDAVCGLGADASMDELVAAHGLGEDLSRGGAFVRVHRLVTAAWRLRVRNKTIPDATVQPISQFDKTPYVDSPAFSFDDPSARFVYGIMVLHDAIEPTRLTVVLRDSVYDSVRASALQKHVSFIAALPGRGTAVTLDANDERTLQMMKDRAWSIISTFPDATSNAGLLATSYSYSRADCSYALDTAIYEATRDALSRLHGRRPQILLDDGEEIANQGVDCTYFPPQSADYGSTGMRSTAVAGVLAGY